MRTDPCFTYDMPNKYKPRFFRGGSTAADDALTMIRAILDSDDYQEDDGGLAEGDMLYDIERVLQAAGR